MNYKTEKGKEIMLYPHGLSLLMDKLPSDNALKIIQEAISYLELMDEPQGSGCVFFNDDYYCQKTPGGKGFAWCVTYLWDIFRMCGLSHLFYDGGRVNNCAELHHWAKKKGLLVNTDKAEYGDIVLFDWYETGRPCHCGFMLGKNESNGKYITLEGNTSELNDSRGGIVKIRNRRVGGIYSVIRPKYAKSELELRQYNGHIRNWRELCDELGLNSENNRKELEKQIILSGYERWGYELGNHLCGSWAVSLFDSRKNETFCMRDHFGAKAMYYSVWSDQSFHCSHDLSDLLEVAKFDKKFNAALLRQYFTLGFVTGDKTFFEGINMLLPGHYLVWNGKELYVKPYWEAKFEPDYSKTAEEWVALIRGMVKKIVDEENDINDIILSDDVASSYLLSQSEVSNAHIIACGKDNDDEPEASEKFAAGLGKNTNRNIVTPEEYFYATSWLANYIEQPSADAFLPVFALGCIKPSKHAEIILSSLGADTLFHNFYSNRNVSDGINQSCLPLFNDKEYKDLLIETSEVDVDDNLSSPHKASEKGNLPSIMHVNSLEGDVLSKLDRIEKMCEMEISVPFCDIRLFDIVRKIPCEYKGEKNIKSRIFHEAASMATHESPDSCRKNDYQPSVSRWLLNERYNASFKDKLFGEISRKFFCISEIEKLWNRFASGETSLYVKLYAIYSFVIWYEINFAGKESSKWLVSPKSGAEAVVVYDCEKEKTVYEENADDVRSIASITKLVSALVIVQHIPDLENTFITIDKDVIFITRDFQPSSAGFSRYAGKKYSALDLLYGGLVPSGCDAIMLLANHVCKGNFYVFVKYMNLKAKEIGCQNSHFLDPCGLIADGKSSARDVALILRAAMQIPILRRIMTTAFYVLPHFNDSVMNTNRLINPIYDVVNYCPYCVGGKTGTSRVAGLCFSSLFERNGKEYIAVVLGENFRLHPSGERMFSKVCKDHVLRIFENTGRFIHISLPEHYLTLEVGTHFLLSPNVLKSTIEEETVFSYSSSDENVAKVDENGEVTVVGKGIAQITVMTQTGDYDICFVNSSGSEIFNMYRHRVAGIENVEIDTKVEVTE